LEKNFEGLEVLIVSAKISRELPDAFDAVEFWTVRRKEVKS